MSLNESIVEGAALEWLGEKNDSRGGAEIAEEETMKELDDITGVIV